MVHCKQSPLAMHGVACLLQLMALAAGGCEANGPTSQSDHGTVKDFAVCVIFNEGKQTALRGDDCAAAYRIFERIRQLAEKGKLQVKFSARTYREEPPCSFTFYRDDQGESETYGYTTFHYGTSTVRKVVWMPNGTSVYLDKRECERIDLFLKSDRIEWTRM